MEKPGKSKVIIEDIAGCGKFQVIVTFCVYFFGNSSAAYTMLFMSFGNFNPGWKCLQQNLTSFTSNSTINDYVLMNDTTRYVHETTQRVISYNNSSDYNGTTDNDFGNACDVFDSCKHVEFNRESSTIVSEFGLICSRKWIPSFMISMQMLGILLGNLFAGYLGDAFGRKMTIYTSLFVMTCFNGISIFSSSWEMFTVMRFLLGLSSSFIMSLYLLFTAEFVPTNWRSFLLGLPAWALSSICLSLTCMYFRHWRHILVFTTVCGALGIVPAVWIPESLRWLEVKNKTKKFENAAKKITRTNDKTLPSMNELDRMATDILDTTKTVKTYNFLHLFKREYRKFTLLFMLPWFSLSLVSYALGFGVKALYGDFYLNLIISNVVSIPFAIAPIMLPNILGRKPSALIFMVGTSVCLLGACGLDRLASGSVRGIGIAVLFFAGRVLIDGFWCVLAAIKVELYPTVVRGLATSWCLFMARIGGVVAPFLIPDDDSNVFISFTTMGILMIICCGFIFPLPETKGRPLKDTFEPEAEGGDVII